jgi:short-subunit dehydrogenase/acyl carrier protein
MGILNHSIYKNQGDGMILVTGASGFLGSALIEKLLTQDKKLILMAHSQADVLVQRYQDHKSVQIIRNLNEISNFEKIETVFHLACPNPAIASLAELMQVNVEMLNELAVRLMPHFARRGWGHFHVMGSRYAYYPPDDQKLLTYSMVKAAQLTATRYWAKNAKLPMIKFVYLAPTHFASPLNRMRDLNNPMPVVEFMNHLFENGSYENGDVVLFDYRSKTVIQSKLGDGLSAQASSTPEEDRGETTSVGSKTASEKDFLLRVQSLFPSTRSIQENKIWGIQFGSIPEWDSLGHLRLIVEIEGAFNKKIPSHLVPKLNTIRAVFNAL